MYIDSIETLPRFGADFGDRHGLVFGTLAEATNAICKLGVQLQQDTGDVMSLAARMASDVETGMTHSAFAQAMMRGSTVPPGPVKGPVTITPEGFVIGGRFAVHNDQGISRYRPFPNHELRINELTDSEGNTRYRLTITDLTSPTSLDPTRVGRDYSESILADTLGRTCPIRGIRVCAFYTQTGPEVEFNFAPIVDALNSMEGFGTVVGSPEDVAEGYFTDTYDKTYCFKNRIVLSHADGYGLRFVGTRGAQEEDDRIARRPLMRRDGSRLIGPPCPTYGWQKINPHATFDIVAPKPTEGTEIDVNTAQTANRRLVEMAESLTNALWVNNTG